MLQYVDDNLVRRLSLVEAGDAHHVDNLANGDADGRTSHEGGDSRERNHVDDPAESSKPHEEDDGACDDGQGRCYNVLRHIWYFLVSLEDDRSSNGR